MRAREIMTPNPVTAPVTITVAEAADLLSSLEIRHLPIVNQEGELVGIISDRDLRGLTIPLLAPPAHRGEVRSLLKQSVTAVMAPDVVGVRQSASLVELVDLMLSHRVGALPVLDDDGELVGIISYVDVLREVRASL